MSYRNNSNVQDVQANLDEAETYCNDLRNGTIEEAMDTLDNIEGAISNAESELSYIDDELAEAEDNASALEEIESRFGSYDPDDWDIITPDDYAERVEAETEGLKTELTNLKRYHEHQRTIIAALLARINEIGALSSDGAVYSLIAQVNDKLIEDKTGE